MKKWIKDKIERYRHRDELETEEIINDLKRYQQISIETLYILKIKLKKRQAMLEKRIKNRKSYFNIFFTIIVFFAFIATPSMHANNSYEILIIILAYTLSTLILYFLFRLISIFMIYSNQDDELLDIQYKLSLIETIIDKQE